MSNQSLDQISNRNLQSERRIAMKKRNMQEEPETSVIDQTIIFEYSGETDLQHVSELILRSQNISGFSIDSAKQLENLELLSLSHNNISSLKTFTTLTSLIELNLNFNNICSLHGFKLPLLEKLFLSNNKLISIQNLSKTMPELKQICLYRNCINDLDDTVAELKGLGKLQKLDLDGNPCSFDMEYRHAIVTKIRKLQYLDGERIQSLDKELAMSYYSTTKTIAGSGNINAALERPSTAPAQRTDNSLKLNIAPVLALNNKQQNNSNNNTNNDGSLTSREATFAKLQKQLPKKSKKLFRSDFLNNHPIMMEYLATGVMNKDQQDEEEIAAEKRAEEEKKKKVEQQAQRKKSKKKRGSFVDRLRGKFNLMNIQVTDENNIIIEDGNYIRSQKAMEEEEEEVRGNDTRDDDESNSNTKRDSSYDALANSISLADPSDPHQMIRKLFEIVEMQESEIEQLKKNNENNTTSNGENMNDIMQEIQILRVENANMFMIKNENERLRKQISLLEKELKKNNVEKGSTIVTNIAEQVDTDITTKSESLGTYTTKLWEENQRLKKELSEANKNNAMFIKQSKYGGNNSDEDNVGEGNNNNNTKKTLATSESRRGLNGFFDLNEEDLEIDDIEEDDYLNDDEVEKLIAKNAKALRQIRHDANMMKQSILLEEDKKSVL